MEEPTTGIITSVMSKAATEEEEESAENLRQLLRKYSKVDGCSTPPSAAIDGPSAAVDGTGAVVTDVKVE